MSGHRFLRYIPSKGIYALPVVLLIGLLILLVFLVPSAVAQSYLFAVPELKMQVYVQPDGSALIVYDITFDNKGRAIDIVDIGTPHGRYDISNMKASIGGAELSVIRPSEFVKPGVEIPLGDHSIASGERGTLHVELTMPKMVCQDTTRRDYASLQITPTWFDGQFVSGSSDIWIAIHMLPGIEPDEMLYQDTAFTEKVIYEGHAAAIWRWEKSRATRPYLVGVSFPQRGMTRVVRMSIFDLAIKWFQDNPAIKGFTSNPETRAWAGLVFLGLFGFLFFRFTGGTGITLFMLLSAGLIWLFIFNPVAHLLAFVPLASLILLNEGYRVRRRQDYLPAIAQVEGGGIKRGLTAPEAAVLLEMPLSKVLTLVVFGMLKKGMLRQVQATPLVVEVVEAFRKPEGERRRARITKHRRRAAQEKGTVLHTYEEPFLDALEENQKAGSPVSTVDFSSAMSVLIVHVAERVKGFDLSDTQDYYRQIIHRALQEAQAIEDISMREEVLDRDFEWILLDDDFPTVFETAGRPYQPPWMRPVVVGDGRPAAPVESGRPSGAPGTPAPGGRTTFGDVAASFVGWTEHTMGSMASAISPGSLQIKGAGGGVINLSSVDRVTGNIFEAMAESSSSGGGGGGGGCACACAGCACACACAGGGR
jgi:hypothetical protein